MAVTFSTLVELLEQSVERFGPRELFGTKSAGAWHFITVAQFQEQVSACRAGMAALGIGPGDRVGMVANNRLEWAVAAYASYGLRAAYVPMYEAQNPEEWAFICEDAGVKLVFGSTNAVFEKLMAASGAMPSVEHVIGLELPTSDAQSYARLMEIGRAAPRASAHPAPAEPAAFIYTSGTTGQPKGAILTHKNLVANVKSSLAVFPITVEDRSLAFLSWAHAFGQTAELHVMVSVGCSMAINDEVPNIVANLAEVKPTILVALPRIFNRIYDGVNRQMAERPKPIRALFQAGIRAAAKKKRGESLSTWEGLTLALADRLIFAKVRGRFGGRLRFCVSGSAALSHEVAEFVDALGIDVFEGYGLTEASPVVSANCPGHARLGTVGKPLPGVRVVIDRSLGNDDQNGEIIVYGENVMRGYHNRPEEQAKMLMADGGLRTGDLGFLDADGYLHITGRIKEQYKLENGKYVVPSPLEEELK
ncbi:MAG TPA: AMP-binding protein, partial [Polyangiaceae bacterium]